MGFHVPGAACPGSWLHLESRRSSPCPRLPCLDGCGCGQGELGASAFLGYTLAHSPALLGYRPLKVIFGNWRGGCTSNPQSQGELLQTEKPPLSRCSLARGLAHYGEEKPSSEMNRVPVFSEPEPLP